MRTHRLSRPAVGLLVTAAVVTIDQISKLEAAHGGSGFVPRNPSYAFGIVGGSAPVLVIAALTVLGAFLVVADAFVSRLGVSIVLPALIAGGTVGNTLDRIQLGAVRDFIVTPWAIVNVADFAVAAGIVGLAIALLARVPTLRRSQTLAPASR